MTVKTKKDARDGIEKTRAAIRTTAAALREQAERALQGHHKPTRKSKRLKAQAAARKAKSPRLETQKDGRLFAVKVLEMLEPDRGDTAAYPYPTTVSSEEEQRLPFHEGKQWDGFQKALFQLFREGTEAAQLGFCAVFTDAISGPGKTDASFYRELENKGLFRDFGTTAKEYPLPPIVKRGEWTLPGPRERVRLK